MTHQAMKQFQFEHKTRRAGQPGRGTRCTYGCPYKTYKNKNTVAKKVQMSKIKAIQWTVTKCQDLTKGEI